MKSNIIDKNKMCYHRRIAVEDPGEEVVISGIAGRYPDSLNVKHFQENLFNKVDLVTEDNCRYDLDHPEIPRRSGKLLNIEKFDPQFFGISSEEAQIIDPQSRLLMEHTYEALVDAGVNPTTLRGSRTGVFIGSYISESESTWFYEKPTERGLAITGCCRSVFANRISYWLDLKGPSYNVDTACSSALFALEHGYRAIKDGLCDTAIVGGAQINLSPTVTLQFSRLGVLSKEGICRPFDADANGFSRSEAVVVFLLQRAKDANRVYATFVHGKTNSDGFKEQGITFPSATAQKELYTEFYKEIQISPLDVEYIEAHGTATKVGDPEELNALDAVFCTGRDAPLKIGSVKSNMGHAETASGVGSVSKVIIAMESGFIPPNLHYKSPREGVLPLLEGRFKVVTETTPWNGGLVGINALGFGGANCHILLKSNEKRKINQGIPQDDLPRLVVISGRTEEAVKALLDDVESRPVDAEHIALLHNIYDQEIPNHFYRGYSLVGKNIEESVREIHPFSGAKRPVWFIFSGIGIQLAGIGKSLLEIPVFRAAIEKCNTALKPHRIDIFNIIANANMSTFDNILHSFVGTTAVQIGVMDILTLLGIAPDNFIGISIGEFGCAYADGYLTAEQTVLAAYLSALSLMKTKLTQGLMAVVGLSSENIKKLCPPDIDIAIHNGAKCTTISGPAESIKKFITKLQADKIFAKELPCSNIALHSRYVEHASPVLLANLKTIIQNPSPRSDKWLSSPVLETQRNSPSDRYCSAEYFTKNLLNSVLFEEIAIKIPKNAICIEITPDDLHKTMVTSSLPSTISMVSVMQHGTNNVGTMLRAVGKLFNVGLQPQLSKFYPAVEFPVSRGTPMIAPNIKWDHSEDCHVSYHKTQETIDSGERVAEVNLGHEENTFMSGHVIDGKTLLPATGYLCLVWETLGMMMGRYYTGISVMFEDVKFLRATNIPREGSVKLTVMIQKGTGQFEISEGNVAVVSGAIHALSHPERERIDPNIIPDYNEPQVMTTKDIYKEFRLRGYQYSGLFRGIKTSSVTGKEAMIKWSNNYTAFLDNMLQLGLISTDTRNLFIPTGIKKIVIDVDHHKNELQEMTEEKCFKATWIDEIACLVCGGIEIRGISVSSIARKRPLGEPVLEEYKFVAHRDHAETSMSEVVRLVTHIAFENQLGYKVKTVEYVEEADDIREDNLVSPLITETLGQLPLIQAEVEIFTPSVNCFDAIELTGINVQDSKKLNPKGNTLLAVGRGFLSKGLNIATIFAQILLALKDGGFILTREALNFNDYAKAKTENLDIVLEKTTEHERFVLLRKRSKLHKEIIPVVVGNDDVKWIPTLQEIMKSKAQSDNAKNCKVLLVGKGSDNGLLGLINCLRQEPGGEIFQGLLIQDTDAPEFSLENPFYTDQLGLDLVTNVLRNNVWGTYRHLLLKPVEPAPVYHIWVNQKTRGDLSSLKWFEGPYTSGFEHEDLIRVYYSSLNFRDIMLTTGKISVENIARTRLLQECVIGFEFCGVDAKKRRVMGITTSRGFTNLIVCDRQLSWVIPENWSYEDAATVPLVYGTAYYALHHIGKMKKGEKILIHSGTGGVGQAAINIALFDGCEVFTTVGTQEKRDFIRKHFPQIPESHIGNSRDTSFEQMIYQQTGGKGVDMVLNSLAEEKLQASIRCLGRRGRFLEIGKFDMLSNNKIGTEVFLNEISFHGIMLDNIFFSRDEAKKNKAKQTLHELMRMGLEKGSIKPLVRTIFTRDQFEDAFRFMAAGKHIGKVIVQIQDPDLPLTPLLPANPLVHCKENRSYIIIGGLGGFGLELVDWLVLRGARNVILTSRTGIKNGYQQLRIKIWKSYGTNVVIVDGKDASKRNDCAEILKIANNLAPVAGIFNLAVVLKDSIFENQTIETFEDSFRPKAWSTKLLDELSRKYCPEIEIFCVFSSVSCGRGNAGQTNYGMSNSIMERICEKRVADGLPGLAIQWGAIGDVGLVAEMQEEHKELVIGGTLQQKITNCLQMLDGFLKQSNPVVSSMVVAEKRAGGFGSGDIVSIVLNIMGLKDLKSVSHQTPLTELGMDSMMAVEIKQTLEREFEVFLTAQDIRALNFATLIEMSSKSAEGVKKSANSGGEEKNTLYGMQMLYRLVGDEDIVPDVCLKMKTEKESGTAAVFLIPGLEGVASVFNDVALKIKSPTYCLQLGVNTKLKTVDDVLLQMLPHVIEKTANTESLTIVGYSVGAIYAIELVRKLESMGKHGRLILIDGSPEFLKLIISQHLNAETDEQIQDSVLAGICTRLFPEMNLQDLSQAQTFKTWEDKLNFYMDKLKLMQNQEDKVALSIENQRAICTAMYQRILVARDYDVTNIKPINSPITLLKASMETVKSNEQDYGLQKFTKAKVQVHTVIGDHLTILDNDEVAASINGDLLENAAEHETSKIGNENIRTPVSRINGA